MTGKHPEGSGRLREPWKASRNLQESERLVAGRTQDVTLIEYNPGKFTIELGQRDPLASLGLLLRCDFEQCAC